MATTLPEAAARIGVISGTAMSTPSCMRPQRIPKPETTAPLTGQIRPPLPPMIGPAGSGVEPVPASCAASSPWIAATWPCSSSSWALISSSAASRLPARVDELLLTALQGRAGVGQAPALRRRSRRGGFDPLLGAAQAGDQVFDLVAQVAHPPDHGLVHAVQPVEVFGAGRKVVEVPGADDHAEQVGAAGFVHRHQPFAQRDEGPLQPGPQFLEPVLGDVELGDRPVELGLLGLQPDPDRFLPGPDRRHLAGQLVDFARRSGRSSWSARPCARRPPPASAAWLRVRSAGPRPTPGRRRAGRRAPRGRPAAPPRRSGSRAST